MKRGRNDDHDNDRRIKSKVVSLSKNDSVNNENNDKGLEIETERPVISDIQKKPDIVQRNRRLFGSIMGHLGSAKKKLEVDTPLIEKQDRLKEQLMFKNAEESQRLRELQIEQRNSQRREKEKVARAKKLERKVAEIARSTKCWKENQLKLAKFLVTSTSPAIYWVPNKNYPPLNSLLSKRLAEVSDIIENRVLADEELIHELRHDNEGEESVMECENESEEQSESDDDRKCKEESGSDDENDSNKVWPAHFYRGFFRVQILKYMLSEEHSEILSSLFMDKNVVSMNEDTILKAYHFALSDNTKLLEHALEVIDKGSLTCFKSESCDRYFWKVKSGGMSDYVVLQNFCPCRNYMETKRSAVMKGHYANIYCKHLIAVRVATSLKKCVLQIVSDEIFVEMMCR